MVYIDSAYVRRLSAILARVFCWILSSGVCILAKFRSSEPPGFGSGESRLFSLRGNFNCARDNPPENPVAIEIIEHTNAAVLGFCGHV
jgi:hypothetical protein